MVENCGWDFHGGDGLNPSVKAGLEGFGPQLDRALSVFLDDVKERRLEDRILLVVCGEMGRTPKINTKGGRDHWPTLAPLLLAGGGVKMGQVIGKSDDQGAEPTTTPVTPADLVSTVLRTLVEVKAQTLRRHPARAWGGRHEERRASSARLRLWRGRAWFGGT
jgi:uncharacterized protein (DUF1501 family)